jgi:hypothetical protein
MQQAKYQSRYCIGVHGTSKFLEHWYFCVLTKCEMVATCNQRHDLQGWWERVYHLYVMARSLFFMCCRPSEWWWCHIRLVAGSHQFKAYPDPDPIYCGSVVSFSLRPDPDPGPYQSDANLRPLVKDSKSSSRAPLWTSRPPLWVSTALDGSILSIWSFRILTLMRIWIRIQLFALFRIHIQLGPKIMRIRIRDPALNTGLVCFAHCAALW